MNLHRILPPQQLPVSLAEVKAGARLDGEDDDAVIAGLIRTAVEMIDGFGDGKIQQQLITATWELRLDAFPGSWPGRRTFRWPGDFCPRRLEIEIPLPPLQSVTSITYLTGGIEAMLDPSEYQVAGIGDRYNKARLRPASAWPVTDDAAEAISVMFVAGYGDSWNDVPEPIRHAITATVQGMYDGCENGLAEMLLRPYRVDAGFV